MQARTYNGSLGRTHAHAESRDRGTGHGVRGQSPPKVESYLAFGRQKEVANLLLSILCILQTQ